MDQWRAGLSTGASHRSTSKKVVDNKIGVNSEKSTCIAHVHVHRDLVVITHFLADRAATCTGVNEYSQTLKQLLCKQTGKHRS